MRMLDNEWYWRLSRASNFFLLNLLWLLMCLPVLTIFPATAALFGVVREWRRDPDSPFYLSFFYRFREMGAQSFCLGLVWTLFGAMLLLNGVLIGEMSPSLQLPLLVLLCLWAVIYLSASVYLLPLLVTYQSSWWELIRNAVILSLTQFGTTVLCLLVLALAIAAFFGLPATILISGSVTAHVLYALCARAFRRVEALKGA
jgi:uncharacterized membrane protein YesL